MPVKHTAFGEGTRVPYKVPGLGVDVGKADVDQIIKYERDAEGNLILDTEGNPKPLIADYTKSDAFQMDRFERDDEGSIIFGPDGQPVRTMRDVAELTEAEKVAADDITVDTVTDLERKLTDPTKVKENAAKLGVSPAAMEAYNTATANYFDNYPEV